jgi:hypothetical protein
MRSATSLLKQLGARIEKWRRSARSGGVEHEGVPATGGDATDYDVKMSDGLGKSVLFDHKCRALPWTQQVYGSPVSVTMSESRQQGPNH